MGQFSLASFLQINPAEIAEIVTLAKEVKQLRGQYSGLLTDGEKLDNLNGRLRRLEKILYVKIVS